MDYLAIINNLQPKSFALRAAITAAFDKVRHAGMMHLNKKYAGVIIKDKDGNEYTFLRADIVSVKPEVEPDQLDVTAHFLLTSGKTYQRHRKAIKDAINTQKEPWNFLFGFPDTKTPCYFSLTYSVDCTSLYKGTASFAFPAIYDNTTT